MERVSKERWEDANKAESAHWVKIMSDKDLANKEDGYYRHAEVMYLNKNNPAGISVIDIGGGPLSLTLHHKLKDVTVVDPIAITDEYMDNYKVHNTQFVQALAEDFLANYVGKVYDEVWLYNCLQHTIDPEYILDNLYKIGRVLRISEPTNTPINTAHPHSFTPGWYDQKLRSIADVYKPNRVDYDYPYVGGMLILK
jgi:2-polyprenyl-3-methyl-5-hydroxy-6-metoxy-1,4-benzoquinol methylase